MRKVITWLLLIPDIRCQRVSKRINSTHICTWNRLQGVSRRINSTYTAL